MVVSSIFTNQSSYVTPLALKFLGSSYFSVSHLAGYVFKFLSAVASVNIAWRQAAKVNWCC